ncbi:hypothetical protein ALQ93_102700 [Pseudomonas syringae pv. pisi]|uniref:Uncharacterized protein n=2 Tax=Pseudomonas syringae group TaxID=136849 RepID=A0A3M2WGY0_PSESJ|nr:hypothetical protein ALQ93_102700 [Pseudomonas syringae pv. pisi]RMU88337.1 hypothetical protein ALP21_102373 [Pseudomonas savastanoi pv. phaseolicola]RML59866.1 hypothetical protein ALQ92_102282 [Pseudomonas syringae pv. pisi]RMM26338.1 hypothetical protein ALQ82_102273 [Pseudomonas syringae pv. pisi]RMO33162.1 hypothetical protein ALQ44_102579 [Pseudomonas syringae pv. pisi]
MQKPPVSLGEKLKKPLRPGFSKSESIKSHTDFGHSLVRSGWAGSPERQGS